MPLGSSRVSLRVSQTYHKRRMEFRASHLGGTAKTVPENRTPVGGVRTVGFKQRVGIKSYVSYSTHRTISWGRGYNHHGYRSLHVHGKSESHMIISVFCGLLRDGEMILFEC